MELLDEGGLDRVKRQGLELIVSCKEMDGAAQSIQGVDGEMLKESEGNRKKSTGLEQ